MKKITPLISVLVAPSIVVMSDQAEVALWTSKDGRWRVWARHFPCATPRASVMTAMMWSDSSMTDMPETKNKRSWGAPRRSAGPGNPCALTTMQITCIGTRLAHISKLRTSENRVRVRRWPTKGSSCLEGSVRVIGSAKPPELGSTARHTGARKQTAAGSLDAQSIRGHLALSHGAAKNDSEDAVRECRREEMPVRHARYAVGETDYRLPHWTNKTGGGDSV